MNLKLHDFVKKHHKKGRVLPGPVVRKYKEKEHNNRPKRYRIREFMDENGQVFQSLKQCAEHHNIPYTTLWCRINHQKMTLADALKKN